MWKWIGGILAIVISGAGLFFLAGPNGLLNPSPERQQQAHTSIVEFNIQPTYTSDDWQSYVDATFIVVNEGDKAAAQCQIEWFSHGDMFSGTASDIFGLMPSERRTIKLRSYAYAAGGVRTYQSRAWVDCFDHTSESALRDIHVTNDGTNWDIW
jgi:hypothetical protein